MNGCPIESYDQGGAIGVVRRIYRGQDQGLREEMDSLLGRLSPNSLESVADAFFSHAYESRDDLIPEVREMHAQLLAYGSGAVDGKRYNKNRLGEMFGLDPDVAKRIKDEGLKTLRSDSTREFLQETVVDVLLKQDPTDQPQSTVTYGFWQLKKKPHHLAVQEYFNPKRTVYFVNRRGNITTLESTWKGYEIMSVDSLARRLADGHHDALVLFDGYGRKKAVSKEQVDRFVSLVEKYGGNAQQEHPVHREVLLAVDHDAEDHLRDVGRKAERIHSLEQAELLLDELLGNKKE